MTTLRQRCEEAARTYNCSENQKLADAIERVARQFAEGALRDVVNEWNVINCGDQAWCDKRIAEAIAAAERGEQ